jgi:hypothetical protein
MQILRLLLTQDPNTVTKAGRLLPIFILQKMHQEILSPIVGYSYEQTGRYKDTYKSRLIQLKS